MSEQTQTHELQPQPSKPNNLMNTFLILVIFGGAIWLGIQNPKMTWKILQVALGFGAVIMIHELGHFLVAKMCGIRIEMFSIGFPPVLLSLKKTKQGLRVRLFPHASSETAADDDDATDYCIGLIPFGGFVKMMGQSDTGVVEKTNDPRSYLNKPIWQRIAVVAAGVAFNAIGAAILFMALFSHGLELMPAVVGGVTPNSPADMAGLKTGDRIVEIEGEKFLDYTSIVLAAALSDNDHGVKIKVEKSDGSIADVEVKAEKQQINDTSGLRLFGIAQPTSLTIDRRIKDANEIEELYRSTGFRPGDVITALNGTPFTKPWQLEDYAACALTPSAKLTVSRSFPEGSEKTTVQIDVPMLCEAHLPNFRTELDLSNIYSMVPRLKVLEAFVPSAPTGFPGKIKNWFSRTILRKDIKPLQSELQKDDIIIQVGDVSDPTYKDLRDQTTAHKGKTLSVTVERKGKSGKPEQVTLSMQPVAITAGKIERVLLGIVPVLDMEHAVVARTIDTTVGPGALRIPAGSTITKVDGHAVESFYDVIRLIRQGAGQRVSIDYKTPADEAGGTGLDVPEQDAIHMQTKLSAPLELEYYREVYKADNPGQAIVWGVKRTWQFIEQSIFTLTGLFSGNVPASSLSGPVGIATISYKMAGQGIMDLLNFLGLLSACLVVMNLLPLPIVDGGVILLLIVEKIRGVPLNPKLLEIITWIGLIMLLSVFVWVTYNDVLRL